MSGMWWSGQFISRVGVLTGALLTALLVGCSQLGTLGTPENPIQMAIVPFIESGRLVKGMQLLSDELKKETGLTYTGDVPTSYAAVVEAMCVDRVDIGWVSPLAYILAREKCGADMSLVSVTRVGTQYWGVVVTRADSPIQKIEDLKGKQFAWVDPGSTSGYLFPRMILADHNLKPEDLGQQTFAGGHDKVGLAILNGQVDAGAMGKDSIPRLNSVYPNAEKELRIVEESPRSRTTVWRSARACQRTSSRRPARRCYASRRARTARSCSRKPSAPLALPRRRTRPTSRSARRPPC